MNKYIKNTTWLVSGQILKMIISLLIGIYVARYLGPEGYGQYSYVISMIMLFSIFANLGLNHLMIREFTRYPEKEAVYLGTATIMRLTGSSIAVIIVLCLTLLIHGINETSILIMIYSVSLIFQSFSIVSVYFESKIKSNIVVLVELSETLILSVLKIWAISNQKPIMWFILIQSIEWLLISTGLLFIYRKNKKTFKWEFNYLLSKKLLTQSWPFIFSGSAVLIYQRIDQVMLKMMVSAESVGYYAVAMQVTTIISIFPQYLARSFTPVLVNLKNKSQEEYKNKQQLLMDIVIFGGIVFTIIAIPLAPLMIRVAFGEQYARSVPVLRILFINGIFYAIAVTTANTLLIESLQKYDLLRQLVGASINIVLNFLLIPSFHEKGAAWSSVIARAFAAVFINFLFTDLKELSRMQINSVYRGFYRLLINFNSYRRKIWEVK